MPIDPENLEAGMVVTILAFDDIPEHHFQIDEVHDDCIGGYSLNGPLKGEYGEPSFDMIKLIVTE